MTQVASKGKKGLCIVVLDSTSEGVWREVVPGHGIPT